MGSSSLSKSKGFSRSKILILGISLRLANCLDNVVLPHCLGPSNAQTLCI